MGLVTSAVTQRMLVSLSVCARRETAITSCSRASSGRSADPTVPDAPNTAILMVLPGR